MVLQQVSNHCITELGKVSVLKTTPFSDTEESITELHRVKEFTASFENDNGIPNHGFEAIINELKLLGIENSTLEVSGFRRILSVSETTKSLLKFFKKYEEFYVHLSNYSEKITYTSLISESIPQSI